MFARTEVPDEHVAVNHDTDSLFVDPSAHLHPGAVYIPAVMPSLSSSASGAAVENAFMGSDASGVAALSPEVVSRKAAWRARISAMARGCVQVLDLDKLLKYDEMSASLPFQLATLDAILKAGRLEYILHPFSVTPPYNLATSDDPGLPDPPPLFLENREGHAVISDSVKGAKPSVKKWDSMAGALQRLSLIHI